VNRRYHDGQADATAMLAKLDIDFVHPWDGRQSTQFWFTASGEQAMVDLTGLRWHARLTGMLPNTFRAGDEHWELAVDRHAHAVVLRNTALEHGTPTQQLTFPLDSLIEQSRLGPHGPRARARGSRRTRRRRTQRSSCGAATAICRRIRSSISRWTAISTCHCAATPSRRAAERV
jgi:hypothetical protein